MTKRFSMAVLLMFMACSTATSQDYSLEIIDEPAKADEVSTALAQQFSAKGYRVKRDASRTVCEIWPCKQWKVAANFEAKAGQLYPFAPGQLIGLLHMPHKGGEFRDQNVASGWYTLRFELQPIDGNHVGTSPTRDFLLIVPAEQDEPDKEWSQKELQELSAEVAGSSHPAMLCLQEAGKDSKPTITHQEEKDWWILHMQGKGVADGKESELGLDIVVAGHAAE